MENVDSILRKYVLNKHLFEHFMNGVVDTFRLDPSLNDYHHPIVHTIKSRLKDADHLKDKIERKNKDAEIITEDNLFERVTDLAGVRVLHLYQDQLKNIHELIQKK